MQNQWVTKKVMIDKTKNAEESRKYVRLGKDWKSWIYYLFICKIRKKEKIVGYWSDKS